MRYGHDCGDVAPVRVLLTGAAGKIGSRVREFLRPRCRLRATDVRDLGAPAETEELVVCDLADAAAAREVTAGMDAVVHLAGIPREASIEALAAANMVATWNVYQGALAGGVSRVVLASSNHVVGFYPVGQRLGGDALPRPDGIYGASKVFCEGVARLFWDKHGLESVCLRIGSALDRPTTPRQLSTWISYDDLNTLIWCSLLADRVGYTVAYGVSDNERSWWSNAGARHLGYVPSDRAQDHADTIGAAAGNPTAADDPARVFQGGPWAAAGYRGSLARRRS